MAFELAPDPGDRGEPDVRQGRTGGSAVGDPRRLIADGSQILRRGAFVCPACAVPLSPAPRTRPREPLRCGFCEHAAAAIEFLREGAHDLAANEVVLVARLA